MHEKEKSKSRQQPTYELNMWGMLGLVKNRGKIIKWQIQLENKT